MIPQEFEQSNVILGPPKGLNETHVKSLPMFRGETKQGPFEGGEFFVSVWKPTPLELEQLVEGGFVYLTMLGNVPPHVLTTSFEAATNVT